MQMNNINKKKIAKRLLRSSAKQLPLANLYIIVLILFECIVQLFNGTLLRYILKPSVVLLMIYYIHNKTTHLDYLVCNITKLGLVMSLIGDAIELSEEEEAQLFSLLFSIFARILFIVAFNLMNEPIGYRTTKIKALLIFINALVFILIFGNLKIVWVTLKNKNIHIFYAFLTACMLSSAIYKYLNTSPRSYIFIVLGSSLLLVSDIIQGYLKYNIIPTRLSDAGIMFTYYTGEYLIMHGSILHCTLQQTIQRFRHKNF